MKRIKVKLSLFLINNIFSGTNFFKIKRVLLNMTGIKVGKNTKIVGPIYCGTQINIEIGENCWIGKNINLDGNGNVSIGNNVDIAPHVVINTGGHKIGGQKRRADEGITTTISIGNGTWIGTRVTIINNTRIGDGNVIAAGALVNKDTKSNVLLAGVPAKIKRELV